MRAALATESGSPDAANEDWGGVLAPGLAIVLDGLSAPDGTGTGCRHGTPWYVSQLGPRLLALASDPSRSLADALAEAIRQVASLHPGCDLTHPGTPSATVVLLRVLEVHLSSGGRPSPRRTHGWSTRADSPPSRLMTRRMRRASRTGQSPRKSASTEQTGR
jgi:hypothetical protein